MIPNDRQCDEEFDVVVIGGGFYGCCIAEFLATRANKRVLIVEQHADLLQRASYGNQARVHGGYHYPRSFLTARRSLCNLSRFTEDFREAICDDFEQIYAIAASGSKVSAQQFQHFCKHIGAPLHTAAPRITRLFEPRFVEAVFSTVEVAFDAVKLKDLIRERLEAAGITVRCDTAVTRVEALPDDRLAVISDEFAVKARWVINCGYAGINELLERSKLPLLPVKHELAEIALIDPPEPIRRLGITVMDGPFFSTMPFPPLGLHSLTHVRYTPHTERAAAAAGAGTRARGGWERGTISPAVATESRVAYMMRDAARFLPIMSSARHVSSLFEIKTILCNNELDDGRPILFRRDYGGVKNLFVVMGGKMDNVYDVLEMFAGLDLNA